MKVKAAVFVGPHKPFEVREFEVTETPSGYGRCTLIASGICGTDLHFVRGTLEGKEVVTAVCGIGKVNAALCAQILCDGFAVIHIVNTGIAGSLSNDLDIGDLVISRDAIYHDFDLKFWGRPIGQVPGMNVTAFPADDQMIDCAFAERKAHKVFAETIDAVKSVGLMQKLRMQLEGIQRSQTKDLQGNWVDLYFYGLLEEDWRRNNGYTRN